tara:strand:- start:110 stop:421 length:312 start_codon:yes stop_codon:yes gene_type:complete
MTWTIHQGYLGDPKGLPIADTLIFVKHKERSYEAIALYTGEHRNYYKKDKDKLFDYLSNPKSWSKEKVENFVHDKFMDRIFNKSNRTLEIKKFLESQLEKEKE